MAKKKSSKSSKKLEKKESKRVKNIYFGEDSAFKAVKDVGKEGVDSSKELIKIAAAQLADLEDLKTKDHSGREKKWSHKTWGGRSYILWRLFYKLKKEGKVTEKDAEKLRMITKSGHKIMEIKDEKKRVQAIKAVLRRVGLKPSEIKSLLEKTNK